MQIPVTIVVTVAVSEKCPFRAVYTFIRVEIKPAMEFNRPGLEKEGENVIISVGRFMTDSRPTYKKIRLINHT